MRLCLTRSTSQSTFRSIAFAFVVGLFLIATTATSVVNAQANFGDQRTLDREEQANINVFKVSSPSVVNISTQRSVAARRGDVTLNLGRIPSGTGSGFIWDSSGHIVTNYHVVEGSDFVRVKLTDGSEWEAEILGMAPEFDVAVLKIEAPSNRLRPLAVGRSDNLEVGQKVYAIGNPFGLDQTLTTGIVSGLGRKSTHVTALPSVALFKPMPRSTLAIQEVRFSIARED